jgi:thiosulfate dehydrogenase (quinone) large subunit
MTPNTYTPTRPPPAVNGGSRVEAPIRVPSVDAPSQPARADRPYVRYLWVAIRLCMAWTFLWPFFDKLIGLNHQTTTAQAWINGGNPTKGFLSGSVGFLSGFYTSIAGAGIVNWLFMIGLLAIGIALAFGIAMRFAAVAGSIMLVAMWSASLPPSDDLILDNHIIYALLLIGLVVVGAGKTFGFGRKWEGIGFVKRHRWLA